MNLQFKLRPEETLCKNCRVLMLKTEGEYCEDCRKKAFPVTGLKKRALDFKKELEEVLQSENVIHEDEWASLVEGMISFLNKYLQEE